MFSILIVLHIIICISLVVAVLMQSAKGEGLAGAFGGGGALSGAVFGGRGAATFLSKATTVLAVAFMVSCIALTFLSRGESGVTGLGDESAVQNVTQEQQQQAPPPQQQQGTQQQQPQTTGGDQQGDQTQQNAASSIKLLDKDGNEMPSTIKDKPASEEKPSGE